MTRFLGAVALLLVAATGGCTRDSARAPAPVEPTADSLRLVPVATGLDFPTSLTAPPGDTARLFITEKTGRIRIVRGETLLPEAFLDLRGQVSTGGERGLLSIAFHPDYARNRRFFVYFTDPEGTVEVAEFRAAADNPDRADAASRKTIIRVPQPYSNHNGGQALFGPDGKLYLGLGDGGSGGDPHNNGQDRGTLLGAILRLDVDVGSPYAIPTDNPFVGTSGARGEVWAYGVRNPWRFSFDRTTRDLYVADVGQNRWEEVNVVPFVQAAGANFGWRIMEGAHCFGRDECDRGGLVVPVLEYEHPSGCSVTGGYAYRGRRLPWLAGTYFYADFCGGWIRSFRLEGGRAAQPLDWTQQLGNRGSVVAFGEDAAGELYLLAQGGDVFRLAAR